jgi:hypothetical protein
MDADAGLNDVSTSDIIMGIVYGVSAIVLGVSAFMIYTKQFRRKKMEAVNKLEFITSRYNVYTEKSQFLFNVPFKMLIQLDLLDEQENVVESLVIEVFELGEHIYEFDVSKYSNGLYYLKLKADNVDMLRKIKINH